MKKILRLSATAVVTALLVGLGSTVWAAWPAIQAKMDGRATECSWAEVLALPRFATTQTARIAENEAALELVGEDKALGLLHFKHQDRSFWVGKEGHGLGGKHLLAVLLADHANDARAAGDRHVRKGDVVLDIGGHVGVFTAQALRQGAAKVVTVEPNPANIECLRRNFAREIAEGRVVIHPKGAWSEATTLTFHESLDNSGMHSAVIGRDGTEIKVEVEPIDQIVAQHQLQRVHFIKMDIEGSEREALKGAKRVLAESRPRLMIDVYHRPDDMPRIRELLPDYIYQTNGCRDCDEDPSRIVPRVGFWTPSGDGQAVRASF